MTVDAAHFSTPGSQEKMEAITSIQEDEGTKVLPALSTVHGRRGWGWGDRRGWGSRSRPWPSNAVCQAPNLQPDCVCVTGGICAVAATETTGDFCMVLDCSMFQCLVSVCPKAGGLLHCNIMCVCQCTVLCISFPSIGRHSLCPYVQRSDVIETSSWKKKTKNK